MRLAKLLILSTCLSGVTLAVQAQTCTTRPSCEDLGYDMEVADCTDKLMLRCPFDSSAVFCGGCLPTIDCGVKTCKTECEGNCVECGDCPPAVTCVTGATCKTECGGACIECETQPRGEFFDGRGNTQKIIAQIGAEGLAAKACNQFYPKEEGISADDETFGQGKWYLPAMGELMKMYGISSASAVTGWTETTGVDASKGKTKVNNGLTAAGGSKLTNRFYWSSSEYGTYYAWGLSMDNGHRNSDDKKYKDSVRCFQLLENCFDPTTLSGSAPQIGDIMFSDKTWSSSAVSGKTPVGVVVDVYGSDVTIVNLKDLTFSSYSSANNFNAASPYSNIYPYTYWSTSHTYITALTKYSSSSIFLAAVQGYNNW